MANTRAANLSIIVSFGKRGEEADHWEKEIGAASNDQVRFIPFNHRKSLGGAVYNTAWDLDRDYRNGHSRLQALYRELQGLIESTGAQCLVVNNDNVYHPDFLLKLHLYRALYSTDDPGATYIRTIPYVHAFHHVFFCAIPYSAEKTLHQKLLECGARNLNFLPLGFFDFEYDRSQTEESILGHPRDIDMIYIGSPFFSQKFQAFSALVQAFRRHLKIYGFWKLKHSVYLSMHTRQFRWVRPVSMEERVRLFQRAKIGFNIHWDNYGLGNQRLYFLPANGVMQICDCPEYLGEIFKKGEEVVPAQSMKDMIEMGRYYLEHEEERKRIALGGFKRAKRDYQMKQCLLRMADMVISGMSKTSWGSAVDLTATRPRDLGSPS